MNTPSDAPETSPEMQALAETMIKKGAFLPAHLLPDLKTERYVCMRTGKIRQRSLGPDYEVMDPGLAIAHSLYVFFSKLHGKAYDQRGYLTRNKTHNRSARRATEAENLSWEEREYLKLKRNPYREALAAYKTGRHTKRR